MDNKILVAYASKAGSTAEVAARIGERLIERGCSVDVLPIDKVVDFDPYSRVILGSAIRAGRPLPETMSFIAKNKEALRHKTFDVFIVCLTMKDDNEENRKKVSAYLDPIRAIVKPASEGLFAGVMNPEKLGWLFGKMMKLMKAPTGDYRNWDQIDDWAKSLPNPC